MSGPPISWTPWQMARRAQIMAILHAEYGAEIPINTEAATRAILINRALNEAEK